MRDAPGEERVRRGGLLVHVGVERVARELREVLDVVERDLPQLRGDLIADAQLGERLAERVDAGIRRRAPAATAR